MSEKQDFTLAIAKQFYLFFNNIIVDVPVCFDSFCLHNTTEVHGHGLLLRHAPAKFLNEIQT